MTESKLLFGLFMITFIRIFGLIFLKISRRTAGLQPLWMSYPCTDRPDVVSL